MGSISTLEDYIDHINELKAFHIAEKHRYRKGFNILMDYWDYLPEEEKSYIDKRLKGCGL